MNSRKLLQAQRIRQELDEWLDRWNTEITAETVPRHLECYGTLCRVLLQSLIGIQGATVETNAYADRIHARCERALSMWTPARPMVKAKARLSLVPVGEP